MKRATGKTAKKTRARASTTARQKKSVSFHDFSDRVGCHPLLPTNKILLYGKTAGFISRGHRLLEEEFRGKGIFSEALRLLESYESGAFKDGRFKEYRTALVSQMSEEKLLGNYPSYRKYLKYLRQPEHIDYTGLPDVAVNLMNNGYMPTRPCVRLLEETGLGEKATKDEIISFIINNRKKLKQKIIFLLQKPVKTRQTE
ncbi:MAG: hypothetical protein ABID38_02480 [Candidatus Diapherotrites archaeon]